MAPPAALRTALAGRDGTVKRIHVDQRKLRAGDGDPVTVQTSAGSLKAREVAIDGPSRLVFSPDNPLPCGARLWVETTAPLTLHR